MRSQTNLIYLFLGVLFNFSCNSKTNDQVISPSSEKIVFSDLVKDYEIVPLFLENNSDFIPESTKILSSKGFLFVYERDLTKRIKIFSSADGQEIILPIKKGEGPNEYIEINDFDIENDKLFLLDGVGRKILVIELKDNDLEFSSLIPLPGMYSRVAKGDNYYYLYSSGDSDKLIHIFDEKDGIINKIHDRNIWYLLKPFNSFHPIQEEGKRKILLHHTFDRNVYLLNSEQSKVFKIFDFESHNFYPKEQQHENFEALEDYSKEFYTRFLIYEVGNSSSFLLFFKNDVPYVHFKSESLNKSYPLFNVENDVTFSETLPKISGVDGDWFLATFERGEVVNPENGSKIKEILDLYPDAENFLLRLKIK